VTPHFTYDELIASQTAARFGIPNVPTEEVKRNMKVLAEGLEKVRALLGKPMTISSGFRSSVLNHKVGGSRKSAHMTGFAADFTCWAYGKPIEIVQAIRDAKIPVDQVIEEGTWVHISFAPTMRNQFMTAKFTNGKASYAML